MNTQTLFEAFLPLLNKVQNIQNNLSTAPKVEKSGHDIFQREKIRKDFHLIVDSLNATFNSMSPNHWPELSLEVDTDALSKNILRIDIPTLKKEMNTNFLTITSLLSHALLLPSTNVPSHCVDEWDSLNLPHKFKNLENIDIGLYDINEFSGYSLSDCSAQSIISLKFWDEDEYDLVPEGKSLEEKFKNTIDIFEKKFQKQEEFWNATPLFLERVIESDIIDIQQSHTLMRDLRNRYRSQGSPQSHHYMKILYNIVLSVPKGGRYGSFLVSSYFEFGEDGNESIFRAKNTQHGLFLYYLENAHVLLDDYIHYPIKDFDIYKLTKSKVKTSEDTEMFDM
jgi:hypothetical protein